MGEVIYTPAFDARRAAEDAARQRVQRRITNAAADSAFWKGCGGAQAGDLTQGAVDPETTDTARSEYVAPDHDCA